MDKFLEIFKLLLNEPEKIKANIIVLMKLLLAIVFAEWLYIHWIGEYRLIDFLSSREWIEYILKGRVFICILAYFLSYIILFYFLPMISVVPFWMFAKVIKLPNSLDKKESIVIWRALRMFQLIDINEKERRFVVMKNTDILRDIAMAFNDKGSKKESRELKDTLMSEIGHTYFVFCVLYFLIFKSFYSVHFLNVIVITGFILIVLFYTSSSILIDLMHKVSKDLIFIIDCAYYEAAMIETMKESGIFLNRTMLINKGFWEFINNEKKYLIKIFDWKKPIDKRISKKCIEIAQEENAKIILFYNRVVLSSALKLQSENFDSFVIKKFEDEEDLINKIKQFISNDLDS